MPGKIDWENEGRRYFNDHGDYLAPDEAVEVAKLLRHGAALQRARDVELLREWARKIAPDMSPRPQWERAADLLEREGK